MLGQEGMLADHVNFDTWKTWLDCHVERLHAPAPLRSLITAVIVNHVWCGDLLQDELLKSNLFSLLQNTEVTASPRWEPWWDVLRYQWPNIVADTEDDPFHDPYQWCCSVCALSEAHKHHCVPGTCGFHGHTCSFTVRLVPPEHRSTMHEGPATNDADRQGAGGASQPATSGGWKTWLDRHVQRLHAPAFLSPRVTAMIVNHVWCGDLLQNELLKSNLLSLLQNTEVTAPPSWKPWWNMLRDQWPNILAETEDTTCHDPYQWCCSVCGLLEAHQKHFVPGTCGFDGNACSFTRLAPSEHLFL